VQDGAVTELGRERILLGQRVQAAENKLRNVEEQNRLLHNQLSTLAEQRAAGEAGDATGALPSTALCSSISAVSGAKSEHHTEKHHDCAAQGLPGS
jgi:hypothetical protein